MCGVFGFIANGDKRADMGRIRMMAEETELRGPHAFGFAWIDATGRLKRYKQQGRISDHLGLLEMAADARVLIGHCRYTTHGSEDQNINNHPHPADGGWIVHNGIYRNYRETIERRGLHPVSECDSEVLGLTIEASQGESLLERCIEAVNDVALTPLVMLGIWKPGRLVIVRRGNPLKWGQTNRGTYIASLRPGLPKESFNLKDNTARQLDWRREGEPTFKNIDLAAITERAAPATEEAPKAKHWPKGVTRPRFEQKLFCERGTIYE